MHKTVTLVFDRLVFLLEFCHPTLLCFKIIKESLACYDSAGIVDLSHLSKFSFNGQNAESLLQSLSSYDVTSLKKNSATDSLLLTDKGSIVAYVTVNKHSGMSYELEVANLQLLSTRLESWSHAALYASCFLLFSYFRVSWQK